LARSLFDLPTALEKILLQVHAMLYVTTSDKTNLIALVKSFDFSKVKLLNFTFTTSSGLLCLAAFLKPNGNPYKQTGI